ncbi:carbohydrate ABC transporter permease [Zhihengliuella halotolerans]|uniref:Carbohydrate ABC transporter membrane protein 1 (CUT1 family) n=1 Tax=Zhihengliuella halotolerans TaxID=370736 RepID=A0A4Q8AHT1_9MICC|nr:sugar ABC transporter permease [Zhihengliuella halotolerans]RZU63471.1 carbohydrate ABC transporter membrane protein 1 (CUT1 family) [Zhihengliuella halotolerans]
MATTSTSAPARPPKPLTSGRGTRAADGPSVWMLAPAFAFFGLFAIVPLLGVALLSLTHWDGLGSPSFAGLENWTTVFTNPVTLNAMWLTLAMTVLTYVVQAPVSILLGVFMAGREKYRAVFSVLYFLPLLFSAAAIGIAFKALLDPNFGLSNAFDAPWLNRDWLGDPQLVFYVLVFVISWSFVPFHSLLYQAGVKQIPASMYEAAMLDGAGRARTFFSVTLPQIKYTVVTSSTLMIVGSLTYFDLVFVMTAGGPGNATRILPLDMYLTGFRSYQMGPASAIAVILVVVGLIVSLLLNRFSGADKMESQMEGA